MSKILSKERIIRKHERDEVRVTDEYVDSILKWITPRDIEILTLLVKHPYLTIDQLEMLAFSNLSPSSWRNKCGTRLRRLYHTHCIDRFFPPADRNAGTNAQIVMLDIAGARVLAKYRGHVGKFKWRKNCYIGQGYRHDLLISDFKAYLHLLNRQIGVIEDNPVGRVVNWDTQRVKRYYYTENGRVKEARLIPDAFCIYQYTAKGNVKLFHLECDNDTESINVLKGKILAYKRYYECGEWRNEGWARHLRVFPATLFLFHDESHIQELISYSKKINFNTKILFSTYDKLIQDEYKRYESTKGTSRQVLQKRNIRILDSIWTGTDGMTVSL